MIILPEQTISAWGIHTISRIHVVDSAFSDCQNSLLFFGAGGTRLANLAAPGALLATAGRRRVGGAMADRSRRSRSKRSIAENKDQGQTRGVGHLRSQVIKRSIVLAGHKTSVSLEDAFWEKIREIAHDRGVHFSELVCKIDAERQHSNLSSAIRLYVFDYLQSKTSRDGA